MLPWNCNVVYCLSFSKSVNLCWYVHWSAKTNFFIWCCYAKCCSWYLCFCIILFMSYSFVKQSTCWKSHSLWFIIQIRMISFISIKLVGYPVPDVLYEFRSIPLVLSSLYLCCYMIVSYIYWWYIVINLEKYLCAIFKLLYISLLYFPIIKIFINFGVLLYS